MSEPVTRTFPLSGPINLHARIGHGTLTVTTVDDLAEATVTLTPRTKDSDVVDRMTVALNGRTLEVLAPREGGLVDIIGGWKRDRESVDAEITVPSGTAIRLMTFSAGI